MENSGRPATVLCPHCGGEVRTKAISIKEMRDAILEKAGYAPGGDNPNVNRAELEAIYNFVILGQRGPQKNEIGKQPGRDKTHGSVRAVQPNAPVPW